MLYIHKHVWVWSSGVSGLLYIWGLDIDRSSGRKETCSSAWGHIYVFLPHGSYEVFGLTKPPVGLRDTSQVSQFAKPSSATKDVAEDPGSLPPILHDLQERSVGRIPATSEHLCRKRLQKEVALCTVAAEHFHSLVALHSTNSIGNSGGLPHEHLGLLLEESPKLVVAGNHHSDRHGPGPVFSMSRCIIVFLGHSLVHLVLALTGSCVHICSKLPYLVRSMESPVMLRAKDLRAICPDAEELVPCLQLLQSIRAANLAEALQPGELLVNLQEHAKARQLQAQVLLVLSG